MIPNCAGPQFSVALPNQGAQRAIGICFARRFIPIRGIYIFLEVIGSLLLKYSDLHVTIAGDGPADILDKLDRLAEADSRVSVIRGDYAEMPRVYQNADIVAIPSLASEGTSLVALEAMAMGKCVVASYVGGLTNVIVNGFNGYLISPTVDSFLETLSFLLDNPSHITRTGANAGRVADDCFAFEPWAQKWRTVVGKIVEIH